MKLLESIMINGEPLGTAQLTARPFLENARVDIRYTGRRSLAAARLAINELDLGSPTRSLADPYWHWLWTPRQAVGRFDACVQLQFEDGDRSSAEFSLQVVPGKLDLDHYQTLVLAMQDEVRALVYALSGGRAGAMLSGAAVPATSFVEAYFSLVQRHVIAALALVRRIVPQPQLQLRPVDSTVDVGELDRIDSALLADLAREPWDEVDGVHAPRFHGLLNGAEDQPSRLPRSARLRRMRPMADTVEQRLLKHVLVVLQQRLSFVAEAARREDRRQTELNAICGAGTVALNMAAIRDRCSRAGQQLRRALASSLLADVGRLTDLPGPTQVMRRDPRYRALYNLYRELRAAPFLAFDCPSLWLPLHELPLLYEQWCALRVVRAVSTFGAVIEQRLIAEPRGRDGVWTLSLQHGAPLIVVQLPDERVARVRYQRRFGPTPDARDGLRSLDTYVRIPDIVVEIGAPNDEARLLVFDAKYRAAPDGRAPQDALDDAYAYRGAIGRADRRATLGSFLLYPGDSTLHTADDVGAIPLLPGTEHALMELLGRWLGART